MSNELERIHRVIGGKVYLSDKDSALISSLFEEAAKQSRAEVLAACKNALCRFCAAGDKPNKGGVHVGAQIYCAAYPILKLQPAAKELKELLWEAELNGLKFSRGVVLGTPNADVEHAQLEVIDKRIDELEKARAILEKP